MDRVRKLGLKRSSIVISCVTFCWVSWACADARLEEIIVVSEKRSESLQDLSQAVTALSGEDLDAKVGVPGPESAPVSPCWGCFCWDCCWD